MGQLNAPKQCNYISQKFIPYIDGGHKISKPKPLIKQLDAIYISELRQKFSGAQVKDDITASMKKVSLDENKIKRLTDAVTEQGNLVRELKTSKSEASVIKAAVAKLLDLKKELTKAQGIDESEMNKNSKKKSKDDNTAIIKKSKDDITESMNKVTLDENEIKRLTDA